MGWLFYFTDISLNGKSLCTHGQRNYLNGINVVNFFGVLSF